MLCDHIKKWFNDYLDGDLDAKKKTKVDAHLKQCVQCRQEFEMLKRADDCLRLEVKRMFKEIPVPGALLAKIEDRIKESGGVRQRLPFYKRISSRYAGAAAALIIFAVSYGAWHQYQHGSLGPKTTGETLAPQVVEQMHQPESNHPVPEFNPDKDADIMFVQAQNDNRGAQSPEVIALSSDSDSGKPARSGTEVSYSELAGMDERRPETAQQNELMQVRQDSLTGNTDAESMQKLSARAKGQVEKENGTGVGAAGTDRSVQMDVNELNQGLIPLIPSYLPSGAVLISRQSAEGMANINYVIGSSQLRIEARLMDQENNYPDNMPGWKKVRINGQNGNLMESKQTGRVILIFNQGNWLITLEGDLPVAEILRIAETLVKA